MSKNTRNRILLTAVAALLLVAMAVGGTLAWLVDTTEEVTNTFNPSTIDVELKETKQWDGTDLGTEEWEAQFIPGVNLTKDPVVSFTTDVAAYVFVKVTVDGAWPTAGVTYTVLPGWTQLTDEDTTDEVGVAGVYYLEVDGNTTPTSYSVLKDDTIYVADTMTQANMTNMYVNGVAKETTMTFQAWIMQKVSGLENGQYTTFSAYEAYCEALEHATVNP